MKRSELRNYGLNIIIKEYAMFPKWLPLPCHLEHGWTALTESLKSDLKTDKPLMLVFSKRRLEAWKKKSSLPAVIMGSPFIHYKNIHNIKRKESAKGTVAFPSHSTYDLKIRFNIENYCKELKKLPKQFHPVTICLFWIDYIKKADIYRKFGFNVVTAGPKFTNSLEFVKNFYSILSNYQHSTSNEVGSYTFYSVDFGVPFFIAGEAPLLENEGVRDANVVESSYLDDFAWGKRAMDVFRTGPVKKISGAQQQFVDQEMGAGECLTGEELNRLLWKYFWSNHFWTLPFFLYMVDSIFAAVIFNGPWVNLIIRIRNESQKFLVPKRQQGAKEKTQIIITWIRNTKFRAIVHFIFHIVNNKLKSSRRLPNYQEILKQFSEKRGLEIGGPTRFFSKKGPLPIYNVAFGIDNVNHAPTTVWTGKIDKDDGYIINRKQRGRQYILDATDLKEIKKNNYDFVFSCDTLEHIANPFRAIEQWLNVLKPKGLIVIIVPKKESNFDHKRKTVSLKHLLDDYDKKIQEDDLSHLKEALRLHDLKLDPFAGTKKTFEERSRNNFENRCLHHHVFDMDVMEAIFRYFSLKIVKTITVHSEHIIIGRKK